MLNKIRNCVYAIYVMYAIYVIYLLENNMEDNVELHLIPLDNKLSFFLLSISIND